MIGDSLLILPGLDASSFDAVITDPPYSSGGQFRSDKTQRSSDKYQQTGATRLPDFTGDSRTQAGYLWWCTMWMADALRVVKPGGWLMVFTDWRQIGVTQTAIEASGWTLRGLVPWIKNNGRPNPGRFTNHAEYVWTATNGAHTADPKTATYPEGWWKGGAPANRVHMTQKPVELMRHLMQVLEPESRILDPFAGSGTTGEAAHLEGHGYEGIDVSEEWQEYAADRVRQGVLFAGRVEV